MLRRWLLPAVRISKWRRWEPTKTFGRFLHAMLGRRGIKLARHFQILRHERRGPGLVQFAQLKLGDGVIGGGGGLQQRQRAGKVRRAGLAFEQHVGQIGLGGGKARFRGPAVHVFRSGRVLGHSVAFPQHHRDIALGGKVLVGNG